MVFQGLIGMSTLAKRLNKVKPSPTLEISAKAAELKAQGHDIINMGVGEPDFNTPETVCQAAIVAIQTGQTKYTAVGGTPDLKQSVISKFKRDNGITYTAKEVLVSTGAKQCIYSLFQAIINPGDEVLVPTPYWVSYPDMILLAEGQPVFIEATFKNSFKITPEQLKKAITPKTKAIILNSPSNPTGMTYTQAEWKQLAIILEAHPDILIISDEIYEYIYWGSEPFLNIINVAPQLKSRTILINGVSKSFAMTGWRIGFAAGPEWLIKGMTAIQGHSTSNPCSIAQVAAQAALDHAMPVIPPMVEAFKKRHDLVFDQLSRIPGVQILPSQGAFYVFPCIQDILKARGLDSDVDLTHQLLAAGVAVVPGTAFGLPGYLRLSYAMHESKLQEALERLKRALV